MAQLKDISGGQLAAGTGTLTCESRICGGIAMVADGTNTGTVVIRETNSSGRVVLQFSSASPTTIFAPFNASGTIYYSISGTGCTAEIFEWQQEKS